MQIYLNESSMCTNSPIRNKQDTNVDLIETLTLVCDN